MQNNIQATNLFATKLNFTGRATQSEHRPSRKAGDGVDRGRDGGKLYPDRMSGEVVTRGAGGVLGCEGSSAGHYFVCAGRKVFRSGRAFFHERGRSFFVSGIFGFISIVFTVLLCRAVLPISNTRVQTNSISKYENKCSNWGIYVRTTCMYVSERSKWNRPPREAHVTSELFYPEEWRRGTLGNIK